MFLCHSKSISVDADIKKDFCFGYSHTVNIIIDTYTKGGRILDYSAVQYNKCVAEQLYGLNKTVFTSNLGTYCSFMWINIKVGKAALTIRWKDTFPDTRQATVQH